MPIYGRMTSYHLNGCDAIRSFSYSFFALPSPERRASLLFGMSALPRMAVRLGQSPLESVLTRHGGRPRGQTQTRGGPGVTGKERYVAARRFLSLTEEWVTYISDPCRLKSCLPWQRKGRALPPG